MLNRVNIFRFIPCCPTFGKDNVDIENNGVAKNGYDNATVTNDNGTKVETNL